MRKQRVEEGGAVVYKVAYVGLGPTGDEWINADAVPQLEVSTPTVDAEAGTTSVMLANALARKPVVPVVVGASSACVATTATSSATSRTSI